MRRVFFLLFALLVALWIAPRLAGAQQVAGAVYNASPPAPANGAVVPLQLDAAGNEFFSFGVVKAQMTAITSSNGTLNATFSVFTNSGVPDVLVQLDQTTTITAGAIKFQVTYDGTNFVDISADAIIDPTSTTYATIPQPYTLQASTNKAFLLTMKGARGLQILMSTALTGTGSVTPYYSLLSYQPTHTVTANAGSGTFTDNLQQVLGAPHSKTNSVFTALSDQTNVITAAISALGTAPTGTEVMTVNDVHLPVTASGAALTATSESSLTTAVIVKGAAGNLYGFQVTNGSASVCYLEFINMAIGPTLGTATTYSFAVPGSGTLTVIGALPLSNYSSGISVGMASTYNGSSACGSAATGVIFYK